MIRLTNGTSDLLTLITAQNGAKAVVNYSDATSSSYTGGNQVTSIASATTTTICGSPAASTIRDIDQVNIYNTYAGAHAITVNQSVSATAYILVNITLQQSECLNYTHGVGWRVLDASGQLKVSISNTLPSLTVTGNATVGGTLGVTGHLTVEGVTSTGATGTGKFVFDTSPALVTPTLGVASATSINKVAVTAPATSATLTLADGSTFATSGAFGVTLTATALTALTLPTTGTLATLAGTEELTNKTLNASVAKGTWTASGTWTLPALVLGGNVTSSGNPSLSIGTGTLTAGAGNFSDTITSTKVGNLLYASGATTSAKYMRLSNTGNDAYFGVESSAGGGIISGSTAYATVLTTANNVPFHIGVNSAIVGTFSSTGLSVTGTLSATNVLSSTLGDVRSVKDGSDTAASGAAFLLSNNAGTRFWADQLSASNNKDWWYFNGATWSKYMTLDASGNLGVQGILTVQGNSAVAATSGSNTLATGSGGVYAAIVNTANASNAYALYVLTSAVAHDDNTHTFIACDDSGTRRAVCYTDGDWYNHDGTYGTISDAKYKSNIVPASDQWNDVKQLSAAMVNYETEFSQGKRLLGWKAQDVQAISAGCVHEVEWNKETALAVDDMTVLKKGFRTLHTIMERIEALEAR